MQVNPYLTFPGNCEEAFTFYAKVLNAKIDAMLPHEGTPAAEYVPPEWRGKILHACMSIGDSKLMASDCPPDQFEAQQGNFRRAASEDGRRSRAHFFRAVGGRHGDDADPGDFLGRAFRYADRPLWHALDDQLRQAGVTFFSTDES